MMHLDLVVRESRSNQQRFAAWPRRDDGGDVTPFFLQKQKGTQTIDDWIGLRENLQETIDFPIKYGRAIYLGIFFLV